MKNAFTNALTTPTPQTERANERQVKNNAGGYVYQVSDKTRLERFLILGTTGGTYYQGEKDLTKQNLDFLINLIKSENGSNYQLVHDTIEDISVNGRAYKNSPAIFATAMLMVYDKGYSFQRADGVWHQSKRSTRKLVSKVCRTATHLYEWAQYVELLGSGSHEENLRAYEAYRQAMTREAETLAETIGKKVNPMRRFSGSDTGGWGKAKRSAVAEWFTSKTADQLAYQAVKYRQRNGWTLADLMRLSHPKGVDKNVGNFILGRPVEGSVPAVITGFHKAQNAKTEGAIITALVEHPKLPWEAVPTQFHKEPKVWKTLFYNGQLKGQALVRNITRLARIGAFDDMVFARDYADMLAKDEQIKAGRLHPMNYLNAIVTHTEGQTDRKRGYGKNKDWATVPVILDALNAGFYKAFDYVEPAGKRFMLAVDVSGSMSSQAMGLELSCAQVAGSMAMAIAKTEPYYIVRGFTSSNTFGGWSRGDTQLTDLGITPNMDLNTVMNNVQRNNFGATDCSLPMEWAIQNKVEIDTFVVLTDNETYAGRRHPDEALRDYRRKMGIDARLVVVGMTSTDFTIANPNDAGMLDVVGADSNLPRLVSDFSAGRI